MPGVLFGLLRVVGELADGLNEKLGKTISWLALALVLLQLIIVGMRYVFGVGSVMLQEGMVYMHASLFLLGAGYTLRHDDHVRCDIFYRTVSPSRRALIDLTGVVIFLLPMCGVIAWYSWPYVINAWSVLEGSPKGSLGLPAVFLLKTLILIFAFLLGLQGLCMAFRASSCLLCGRTDYRVKDEH